MEQSELEERIEKARLDRSQTLSLTYNQITILPKSIGNLTNLTDLILEDNQLICLPDTIGNMVNLNMLYLDSNSLVSLPESIGKICNLTNLYLSRNKLASLPKSMSRLTNLEVLSLNSNPLIDLSILQDLPKLETVEFMDVDLPRRYWTKLSDWKAEWLLDEDNSEIRHILIEQLGYEKICAELNAINIDSWREYTLLKIDGVEAVYEEEYDNEPTDREPMLLLKMTCPSTEHIHILRVPPEMTSAEAAITWVNHGIHPDKFAVQT
jgi:leucine-rich repeat protein SHOC2